MFKNPFKSEPTLEELQEKQERRTIELDIKNKEVMIQKLETQGKHWKEFSNNGKKSGISWEKIRAFLKGAKGGKK